MAGGDACLLDSNILLRMSKGKDPRHDVIHLAIHSLVARGSRLCYTSQTLGEFWNVATRPLDKNGFGLSIAETDRLADVIERDFEVPPDIREVHEMWHSLLVTHNVRGVQVHDARLAASMYAHAVGLLLPLYVSDFRRFTNLRAVHPADLSARVLSGDGRLESALNLTRLPSIYSAAPGPDANTGPRGRNRYPVTYITWRRVVERFILALIRGRFGLPCLK